MCHWKMASMHTMNEQRKQIKEFHHASNFTATLNTGKKQHVYNQGERQWLTTTPPRHFCFRNLFIYSSNKNDIIELYLAHTIPTDKLIYNITTYNNILDTVMCKLITSTSFGRWRRLQEQVSHLGMIDSTCLCLQWTMSLQSVTSFSSELSEKRLGKI